MTDYTEKQLEWAARLLCVAHGIKPDKPATESDPMWRCHLRNARRLLDELQRQGVKVTSRKMPAPEDADSWHPLVVRSWIDAHDYHPVCPEAE